MTHRPFLDARTAAKPVAGADANAFREWQAWGIKAYGRPFVWDTFDDTARAYLAGGNLDLERERRIQDAQ